ncbi:hypothetical protein ACF1BB_26455 [Streptomyces griseoluteus]|uniref:hypothetical protein n=1 Tax=Streptomyces griseoluteus TaxID=29306 RepID=UPI0036FAB6FD
MPSLRGEADAVGEERVVGRERYAPLPLPLPLYLSGVLVPYEPPLPETDELSWS